MSIECIEATEYEQTMEENRQHMQMNDSMEHLERKTMDISSSQ